MRILIFTPPSNKNYVRIGRCGGSSKGGEQFPPIKLMYLAGIARQDHEVKFIDADVEWLNEENFLWKVKKFNPDLLVCEPTAPSLSREIEIIKKIKKDCINARCILIGAFVSALPEQLMEKYKDIDYIIKGEAEKTFSEILEEKTIIEGAYYRRNNKVVYGGRRDLIKNLDKIPFPAHNLIPFKKYRSPFINKFPFTIMELSRGCPYSCTYCNSEFMNGKKTRFRSIDDIIEELKLIKSLGIKSVYFNDETFAINKDFIKNLMNKMIEEKIKIKWVCNTRVDSVDNEILNLMKKAGCYMILYGVESGDQSILDYYKKNIKVEKIIETFELSKKNKIKTVAHFIFGAPNESWDTINKSIELAIKIKPDLVSFNLLTPYPGTKLYQELSKKYLIKNINFDQTKEASLDTSYLKKEELEKGVKLAYKKFYYRPSYILKKGLEIRNLNNIKVLFKGLNNLIRLTK